MSYESYAVWVQPHIPLDGESPYAIAEIELPDRCYPPAGVQVWNGFTGHGVECDKHIATGVLTLYFDPAWASTAMTVVVI